MSTSSMNQMRSQRNWRKGSSSTWTLESRAIRPRRCSTHVSRTCSTRFLSLSIRSYRRDSSLMWKSGSRKIWMLSLTGLDCHLTFSPHLHREWTRTFQLQEMVVKGDKESWGQLVQVLVDLKKSHRPVVTESRFLQIHDQASLSIHQMPLKL